jgi:sec-independent protein translocase protein TatC
MALRLDQQDGSSPESPDELRLTLGEHLEEIRVRLFKIVAGIAVGMTAGSFLVPHIYSHLNKLVANSVPKDFPYTNAWTSLAEPFMFWIKMSVVVGAAITLPLTVMQIWGFVKPGLRPHERRPLQIVVPISILLFAVGAGLGYVILPVTFAWFADVSRAFTGTAVIQNPSEMILFCVKMMFAFGVGFQLPLIVFFLTKLGIITPEAVTRYWRQAAVGVFAAVALITPSGDLFTMSLMGMPLVMLTFGSIGAARLTMRGRDSDADVLNALD